MILAQGITTPDGTVLQSRHRHDYITYQDKNGQEYMVDGGTDYLRRSANGDEFVWEVTDKDDFEVIRHFVGRWGHGKDMKGHLRFTPVAKMSNDYLTNAYIYALANNQPTEYLSKEIDHRAHYHLEVDEEGNYIY
jgi:hypothetical protein